MNLSNKIVVFVGGMGGIGLSSCKSILERGIQRLFILDIPHKDNSDKISELQKKATNTEIDFLPLDLTQGQEKIKSVLDTITSKVKTFDVLVNNSGIIDERHPKRAVDINLTGLIETTLTALPIMSKNSGGNGGIVLNCASVLGLEAGHFLAVYTASKHGVIGFTKCLAHPHYYNVTGVQHVAFCPGFTVTNMTGEFLGRETFDYSKPISEKIDKYVMTQSADACGEHMAEVLEVAKNGAIWISDLGKKREVTLQHYWEYPFKNSS